MVTVTKVFALSATDKQPFLYHLLTLNPPGYPDVNIFVAV